MEISGTGHFTVHRSYPTGRNPINFTYPIKNHVKRIDKNCTVCGKDNNRLEVCHLFSCSPQGVCYDVSLPRYFIQSPENAALMCRTCSCRLLLILRFLTNKISKPGQRYKLLKCYICGGIATNIKEYKNMHGSWKISYCKTCYENVTSILEYMSNLSPLIMGIQTPTPPSNPPTSSAPTPDSLVTIKG